MRDGRDPLRRVIGPAAEEIAFAICTSDRLGLMGDLLEAMYGGQHISGKGLLANIKREGLPKSSDGNQYPQLTGKLTAEGFPVRNHITQKSHVLTAEFFAQFVIVFVADFMDQGALGIGSADMDICLFQFMRFTFFNDVLKFVSPYLRVIPPVRSMFKQKQTNIDFKLGTSFCIHEVIFVYFLFVYAGMAEVYVGHVIPRAHER